MQIAMNSQRSERFQRVGGMSQESLWYQLLLSFFVSGLATAYQAFLILIVVGVWTQLYFLASGGEAQLTGATRRLSAIQELLKQHPLLFVAIQIANLGIFLLILRFSRWRTETCLLLLALTLLAETVAVVVLMCLPLFSVVYVQQ